MPTPIRGHLAGKRIARLQARVRRLDETIATRERKGDAVSYFLSERSALKWAIDELLALYPPLPTDITS